MNRFYDIQTRIVRWLFPPRKTEEANERPAVKRPEHSRPPKSNHSEEPNSSPDEPIEGDRPSRGLFRRLGDIVKPEERFLKNLMSPRFWKLKREEYGKTREIEQEHLGIFQSLSEGSSPTGEYYILTLLSSVIATAGLIQGSAAAIIGAMVVAPLMTPIFAFSLGVVWGDLSLIRKSLFSFLFGTLLAIFVSSLLSAVIPAGEISSEILARTRPTVFDIVIALASGTVGAYVNVKRKIMGSFVGIAIAVALMPPLCTIGIGIGNMQYQIAAGAAVLFIINFVAISLAGAVVFWVMKVHPIRTDKERVKRRALSEIVISVVILLIISVPVIFFMVKDYAKIRAESSVVSVLKNEMPESTVLTIKVEPSEAGYDVTVTLTGDNPPDESRITAVKEQIYRRDADIEMIRLSFIRSIELTE